MPLGGEKIPGEVVTRKDLSHFLLRLLLIYNDIERVAFMKTFPTGGVQFASPGWLTFTFSIRTPLCVFTNFINTNRCGLDSFEGRKQRSTAPTRHAHQLIGSFESCGNSS